MRVAARRRAAPRERRDDVGARDAADRDGAGRRGGAARPCPRPGPALPAAKTGTMPAARSAARSPSNSVSQRPGAAVVPRAVDDARRVVRARIAVGVERPFEDAVHGARRAPAAVAEDARGEHAHVRRHRDDDRRRPPCRARARPRRTGVVCCVVGVEPAPVRGRELREAGDEAGVEHRDDRAPPGLALRPQRGRARRGRRSRPARRPRGGQRRRRSMRSVPVGLDRADVGAPAQARDQRGSRAQGDRVVDPERLHVARLAAADGRPQERA